MTTVYVRNLRTDEDYDLNLLCTKQEMDNFLNKYFDGGEDERIIVDCDDFAFDELEDLYSINEFVQLIEDENVNHSCAQAILNWTQDMQYAINIIKNQEYYFYEGTHNMGDVAYEYLEEGRLISELPENVLDMYFDYDAFGRDMEINGSFTDCDDGIIEFY